LTTESEYVAVTHASKEALWLRSLISQLFDIALEPTTLFSDNQSAIALTNDHQYHLRTKDIDIRFHFIRWIIENGSLRLVYCPTEDMLADTLRKSNILRPNSDSPQFEGECCDYVINIAKICIINSSSSSLVVQLTGYV
jgi:hypothetical protein